jgi:hypothetical protein
MSNHQSDHPNRIFILSPAKASGKRAQMLLNPNASFGLAVRFRNEGAPLGEVFSFMSGLYFRGKLTYASRFARNSSGLAGVWVITPDRGLVSAEAIITSNDLSSFSEVPIHHESQRYVQSLRVSAQDLAKNLEGNCDVVLLGSIGTKKYTDLLLEIFDVRLKFPSEFVGRGDMSRGGLLLRCAEANQELEYISVAGAICHGKRPPKLEPKRRSKSSL